MIGLRHRAAALNDELRIESPVGVGTTVTATLPVQAPDPASRREHRVVDRACEHRPAEGGAICERG